MNISDVWLNVSKKIKFFTKETKNLIPERAGIYAWFIPLWLYKKDISELVDVLNKIMLYDSSCCGEPKKSVKIPFNWDQIEIDLKKAYKYTIMPDSVLKKKWDEVIADEESKNAISQILMEASIFMPPLYVGKTRNLKQRYFQHIDGSPYKKNDFHNRFTEHLKKLASEIPLTINDLLFACIFTDQKSNEILASEEINSFIETIMLKICKPIFSIR